MTGHVVGRLLAPKVWWILSHEVCREHVHHRLVLYVEVLRMRRERSHHPFHVAQEVHVIGAIQKTTAIGEPARMGEMEEIHPRRDAGCRRCIADPPIPIERGRIESPALRLDTAPFHRQPVVSKPEGADLGEVLLRALPEAVAGIRRRAALRGGLDPVVRNVSALRLERRGRDAPEEVRRQGHDRARKERAPGVIGGIHAPKLS